MGWQMQLGVARDIMLVEFEITITPAIICQYFFIFYFKPKYFLHILIIGRVDFWTKQPSLAELQINCNSNDSSALPDFHILLYCHISPYYDNDASVT